MKLWMYASLALILLSLSACQASSEGQLEHHKQRALAELAKLSRPAANTTETVQYADKFFAPELEQQLQQEPSWYSEVVNVNAKGMPLEKVLRSVFPNGQVQLSFAAAELAQQPVALTFNGYRGDFIKALATNLNWHVDYDEQHLRWSRWQTAEFDIAFIAGASEYFMGNKEATQQRRLGGQQGTAASPQRSSEQYSNFRNERLSVWDDLQRTLQLLLSEHGVVSLNQSSTSVAVRDTPYHVRAVADYLEQQNERLTRQVAIEVQIIEVNFTDEQQLGVDWQALRDSAGGNVVLGLGSGGLGEVTDAIASQVFWQRQNGRMAGSEVFIQALEQQGLVRINNQPRVVSLNNQIAKIALQDNATYLASAGTTSTVNVGATTTLQPGVVTTGFELYLLPSIRDGEVILQLSTELSDLQRIDEVRSGEQLIQTPHTNRKQFFMQAAIADGQTLLLSGLRNERSQLQQQQSWLSLLLGGQQIEQQQHSETLVLLTPTIINRRLN